MGVWRGESDLGGRREVAAGRPVRGRSRAARQAAVLAGMLGLLAACSGTTVVGGGDGGSGADTATGGTGSAGQASAADTSETTESQETGPERIVPRVDVPFIPPIVLPDVSVLSTGGAQVEQSVGALATPTAGLDVLSASCAADGGALEYQGGSDDSFFSVATDGSGTYSDVGGDENVTVVVEEDGSGTYSDVGGDRNLTIVVAPDGSGTYSDLGGDRNLTIVVEPGGFGTYSDYGGDRNLTVVIASDGSGSYTDYGGAENLTISALPDGSGTFTDYGTDQNVTVSAQSDGSWSITDYSVDKNLTLTVNADGSGTFTDNGPGTILTITVDSNGQGTYVDDVAGTTSTFTTDIGILDPKVLVAGPRPVFAVADRFPPLDKLGRLTPPCATVVRLDADVMFDFDSDQLRPEAAPVVEAVAQAVIESGDPIEVQGHTDSKGADDYNLDLSERRAESFKAALVAAGVTSEITTTGFGETRPVAPNEKDDGSDDPAGRQLNRRIEVVFPE